MLNHPPQDRMMRPKHIRSRIAVRPVAVSSQPITRADLLKAKQIMDANISKPRIP